MTVRFFMRARRQVPYVALLIVAMALAACSSRPSSTLQEKPSSFASAITSGFQYQGGPIMNNGRIAMYAIYYGDVPTLTQAVVNDFLNNLGGSPIFATATSYRDGAGVPVSNSNVYFAGERHIGYLILPSGNQLRTLEYADVQSIIAHTITDSMPPMVPDPDGVYFFIAAADVDEQGGPSQVGISGRLCDNYCGWHDHMTVASTEIKYAFIGNPQFCIAQGSSRKSSCQNNLQPPNDLAGDEMVNSMFHEAIEAVTNPYWDTMPAYVDSTGGNGEIADACGFSAGRTFDQVFAPYFPAGHGRANTTLGNRSYFLQNVTVNGESRVTCARRPGTVYQKSGDYDGDNSADYANFAPSSGTLEVHLAVPFAGTFEDNQAFFSAPTCTGLDCSVLIGDFDCDSRSDLATRNKSTGAFSVFINNSFGFTTPSSGGGTTCGGTDCDVLVGDFNGDCLADYADVSWSQATFWVHTNNGTSPVSFSGWGQNWATVPISCATGPVECELLVGDFDGDGWDDYAEHDMGLGRICVYHNNHDTTFGSFGDANYCYSLPSEFVGPDWHVLTGDFNRDRMTDLGLHHATYVNGKSQLTVFASGFDSFGPTFVQTGQVGNPCTGADCRVLGAAYE